MFASMEKYHELLELKNESIRGPDGRVPPVAMLSDNTTVFGKWERLLEHHVNGGHTVNEVTMILPHSGLFEASRSAMNGISVPSYDVCSGWRSPSFFVPTTS